MRCLEKYFCSPGDHPVRRRRGRHVGLVKTARVGSSLVGSVIEKQEEDFHRTAARTGSGPFLVWGVRPGD